MSNGSPAVSIGFIITKSPVSSISVGHTQYQMGRTANLRAWISTRNWFSAPSRMIAPSTYISDVTKAPGMRASTKPSIVLPRPTMGNAGFPPAMIFPSASYTSFSAECMRALKYATHEMMPETRNSTPMAIVIPLTVLSGFLMSIVPTAMAQTARNTELCSIFMSLLLFLVFTLSLT